MDSSAHGPTASESLWDSASAYWRSLNSRRFVQTRIAGMLLIAAAVTLLPQLGPMRFAVSVVLALVFVPALVVVERTLRPPALDLAHPVIDAVGIVVLVHLIPTAWLACLVIAGVSTAGGAGILRGRAFGVMAFTIVGMAFAAWAHDVDNWIVPLIGYATALPPVINHAQWLRDREHGASERIADLVETATAMFWEADATTGAFRVITGDIRVLTGHSEDVWRGWGLSAMFTDDDVAAIIAGHGTTVALETTMPHADSRRLWFRHFARTADSMHAVRGVSFDITALVEARREVTRYLDIVDRVPAAVLVLTERDGALVIDQANPATDKLLGRSRDQFVGRVAAEALPGLVDKNLLRAAADARRGAPSTLQAVTLVDADTERVVDVDVFGLPDDGVVLVLDDITEVSRSHERMRHLAEHDPLTGAANRDLLLRELGAALSAGTAASLLLIDLDRFKEVNDTLGHHSGDRLLVELCDRLRRAVRSGDLVARLGGDEFAVLLPDTGGDDALVIAGRILHDIVEPIRIEGLALSVAGSIGLVTAPGDGRDPHTLLRRADLAMYDAKRSGGAVRTFASHLDTAVPERLALASELRQALEGDELELWFQPKIDLRTRRAVGVEGLIRWRHPTRGVLTPDAFLDLVATAGLAKRLNLHVMRLGIAALADLLHRGIDVHVAVNLDVRSLFDLGMPARIAATLGAAAIPADRLVLEVTEGHLADEAAGAEGVLAQLDAIGVSLSIDDFGTGHSSLTRLRDLPVSELKIDRSFVAGVTHDSDARVIVRSVVDLGHTLGMRIVAEGVEDEEAAAALAELGCDLGQGWLWSAALPLGELHTWLDPASRPVDLRQR